MYSLVLRIVQNSVLVKCFVLIFVTLCITHKKGDIVMADMWERIDLLLAQRGISGAKMSSDLGMSRSFMTELRKGRAKSIKLDTAQRIAAYFGVSVNYLLDGAEEAASSRPVSDDDIKFALFGGDGEITDEMYEEVKRFAAYVKQREGQGK